MELKRAVDALRDIVESSRDSGTSMVDLRKYVSRAIKKAVIPVLRDIVERGEIKPDNRSFMLHFFGEELADLINSNKFSKRVLYDAVASEVEELVNQYLADFGGVDFDLDDAAHEIVDQVIDGIVFDLKHLGGRVDKDKIYSGVFVLDALLSELMSGPDFLGIANSVLRAMR